MPRSESEEERRTAHAVGVREVRAHDVDVCAALERACFPPAEAASRSSIERRALRFPEGFLVLESGGQLVGMLNSGAADRPDLADEEFKALVGHDGSGAQIVVFSLAVHPEHQRRGHARALLEAFVARERARGRRAVLLLCKQHLVDFYQRLGFRDAGPSASNHGGARWHEMRCDLLVRP